MRILLDHCVPRRLKRLLSDYEVKTAREAGVDKLKNGALLARAAEAFDVLLTVDQNIKHQQNLSLLPVSIIVIFAITNRLEVLAPCVPEVKAALSTILPGQYVEVCGPN